MKLSKIFHFLYFSVLSLPLVSAPIFAIYSQNHEINDNTLQVQETQLMEVDFNQYIQNGNFVSTSYWNKHTYDDRTGDFTVNGNVATIVCNKSSGGIYYGQSLTLYENHQYLVKVDIASTNNDNVDIAINSTHSNNNTTNEFQTFLVSYYATADNTANGIVQITSRSQTILYVQRCMFFDLTQMYGIGNEPTGYEFNLTFNANYYQYTTSEEMVIENYETITYNDTDIMSQFIYSEYNFMDKYLPMYKYQPYQGIYQWIQNTFFSGSAPLVFTIFYQWFAYWLFVSLCWLIFDVLMYVPLVVHRWLDKGALE